MVTVGNIWKHKQTGKEYELVGRNNETGMVQLYPMKDDNDESYKCIPESKLRKEYSLIGKADK